MPYRYKSNETALGSVGKLWASGGTAVSAVRHGLSDGRDARPTDFSDGA